MENKPSDHKKYKCRCQNPTFNFTQRFNCNFFICQSDLNFLLIELAKSCVLTITVYISVKIEQYGLKYYICFHF